MQTFPSSLRIFVSHSRADDDFGVRLVQDLRRVLGSPEAVWYDSQGGLFGGDQWWSTILREIKTREVFLVILSPEAMDSKWVDAEITIAWQQKLSQTGSTKRIIPILYRPCEGRDDLNTLQMVSFVTPRSYTEAFDQLLLALQSSRPADLSLTLPRKTQAIVPPRDEPQFVWSIPSEPSMLLSSDKSALPPMRLFYGRQEELARLNQDIIDDRCRIVAVLGMGGIGKTSLAAAVTKQVHEAFDEMIWCSLRSAPPLEDILKQCVLLLSKQEQIALPLDRDNQIALLLHYLKKQRSLIVMDNVETILRGREHAGQYLEGYEDYGRLLQSIGEIPHCSCLLLTSREKPNEVVSLEGTTAPVRSLALSGLEQGDIQEILKDNGLFGSEETWRSLTELYSGNPLALKLVAEPIRSLFNGDVSAFLKEDAGLVQNIHALLAQQFQRLSPLEQEIMYWLAIEREGTSLDVLREDIVHTVSKRNLLAALSSLRQRSMVELSEAGHFTLPSVISEYVTEILVEQMAQEIEDETMKLLGQYALMKAQAKDYVRETQVRLILTPLSDWLLASMSREELERKLQHMLAGLRQQPSQTLAYAAGNICNLLIHLHYDLRGYDFSHLTVRQAYLQGAVLPKATFAYSNLVQSIFTENFGSVLTVALSPRGDLLAGGTADGEVRLWAVASGTLLHVYTGHTDRIWSVVFHPDGRLLASSSEDETVRLWDIEMGTCLNILYGHTSWIRSIAFSPDGNVLASASADRTIRFWDTGTGTCLNTLHGHTSWVRSVVFSSDGKLLASSSEDRTIRLWNVATGSELKALQGHTDRVWSVAFQPNGKMLASSSEDKTVRLWDVETGTCLNTLYGHTERVRSVIFSPDGNLLASGSENYNIRLWEVSTGQCLRTLQTYKDRIWSIAFRHDGAIIASGSMDQTVRLWEVSTGQCLKTFQGYTPNRVWSVAFSPDGKLLTSGGMDRIMRLWEVSTGQCLKTLQGHSSHIRSVAFSPDGKLLASGGMDRTICLWDVPTGRCLRILRGHNSWVWSIAFHPDGSTLASGSVDQTVRLWDVPTGRCTSVLEGHTEHVRPIAFHPDGGILASGSDDQTIRIWDIRTTDCVNILRGHTGRIWSLDFSPDGQTLVSGSEDQTIRLWNLGTAACQLILQGHTKPVTCVSFSPDGQVLVSGGDDGEIQMWSIQDKTHLSTLKSERPYEKMNITGIMNLTDAQKLMLKALGAIEEQPKS